MFKYKVPFNDTDYFMCISANSNNAINYYFMSNATIVQRLLLQVYTTIQQN